MSFLPVTIDLPQDVFSMQEGTFRLTPFSSQSASRYRPSLTRTDGPHEMLWTFEVSMAPVKDENLIWLEGWVARLAHKTWAFRAYDSYRKPSKRRGVGGGFADANAEILFTDANAVDQHFCSDLYLLEGATTALVKTAAARNATAVVVKGLDSSLEGERIVRLGDHVGFGVPGSMNLYMAQADAVCDASGEARIVFAPGLWLPLLANDVVNFHFPTARFQLFDDQTGDMPRNINDFARASLKAIEVPYQQVQA